MFFDPPLPSHAVFTFLIALKRRRSFPPDPVRDIGRIDMTSIWRVDEAMSNYGWRRFFFAVDASATRQILVPADLIRQLGSASFPPHMVGWANAAWAVVLLMALWYLVCGWNEQRKQSGVLKT